MNLKALLLYFLVPFILLSQEDENEPYITFDKPDELIEVSSKKTIDKRFFQNENGVTFACSKSRKIDSHEQVKLISAMSLLVLKGSLNEFELQEDDCDFKLNEHIYCGYIYTYKLDQEEIISYSFHTMIKGRLINFIFSCPISLEETWSEIFLDIMLSVEW